MKIRNDFITNSSSSSYIIAINENNLTDREKKIVRQLLAFDDHIDTYPADDVTQHEKFQDKFNDIIKKGYKIYSKEIGYGGGELVIQSLQLLGNDVYIILEE